IADHVADGVLGEADRDQHDRLEQHRPGLLHRLLHRDRAGDLERHLGGVDRVIGAVVDADADVLDRIAGHDAFVHSLDYALLDGGNEAGGYYAALERVDGLEPRARLERLDLDVAVAELAAPAALLLVAAMGLGRLSDRFLVGNARRLEVDLGAEALLEPLHDHLDVDLT